ncbi:hypothetical protein PC41400_21540 [Paenibacillus chitinolyticus]|uniref:Uncharacterized protein n=1 Tax=Paenibacillus chitinolyticus TaxID=79263 RepID=A0A410X0J6_9BACL|nr:hypothetical protein [Paenibacillus chitinolyticus]MCY9593712.1 hypothetical protein [Paenibacillus chitinolyticus]MCY9599722.1 hypothetical protein [Paenibacillus chitinolyticus]QAV20107.1 hypothetical protein PC41400_21540 [Paenibacillus chitinolyticus]
MIILFLSFFTLIGCLDKTVTTNQELVPENVSKTPDPDIDTEIFHLNDKEIQEAIELGKSLNRDSYKSFIEKNYALESTSDNLGSLSKNKPVAMISTPYEEIVSDSYNKSQKFEKYDVEDAKYRLLLGGSIFFYFKTYGDEIRDFDNLHAVLKQDESIVQPYKGKLTSNSTVPELTKEKSPYPAYTKVMIAQFTDIKKNLDLSKPVELIFMLNGKEQSVTYSIEISKYK